MAMPIGFRLAVLIWTCTPKSASFHGARGRVLDSGQAAPLCSAMLPFFERRNASGVAMAAASELAVLDLGNNGK